jgi:cell wall-associated NlpC family hydrolase
MPYKPRGAGRSLLLVALLVAATALLCAASSVRASSVHAVTRAPRRHPGKHRLDRRLATALATQAKIHRAVRAALSQRGVRYRYGGSSPASGFDCSGLVAWAFVRAGVQLPHSSYQLAVKGRRVLRATLRAGDLVFFSGSSHVGIYLGGGRFVHAPHSGTVVRIDSLRVGWYRTTYDGARRVLVY